eukprot:5629694-Karenia_brevis.AAC.1
MATNGLGPLMNFQNGREDTRLARPTTTILGLSSQTNQNNNPISALRRASMDCLPNAAAMGMLTALERRSVGADTEADYRG